jgi:hypothetical protein
VSMTCGVCAHPERAEMERRLASGGSMRAIAASFGVSRSSFGRHVRSGHIGVAIFANEQRERDVHAEDLLERIEFLWASALSVLEEAGGRPTVALAAVKELRQIVELLGRLSGAVGPEATTLIELSFSPDRVTEPPPWVQPRTELVPGRVIDVNAPEGGDGA